MSRWIWGTAVAFVTVIFALAGCASGEAEPMPELTVTGPAFILFYTDN